MKKIFRCLFLIMLFSFMFFFTACSGLNPSDDKKTGEAVTTPLETTPNRELEPFTSTSLTDFKINGLEKYTETHSASEYLLKAINQEFTLELSLYNPDHYIVNSLKISGVNYDSSDFTSDNNYDKITIKMRGRDYGFQVYQIESLNYDFKGKPTEVKFNYKFFVLRLASKNAVRADNFTFTASQNQVNFKVEIKDVDKITQDLKIKYYVVEKENEAKEIYGEKALKIGNNDFVVKGLKEYSDYKLVFYYEGDFINQGGSNIYQEFSEFEFKTTRALEVTEIVPDYEAVSFKINNLDSVLIKEMYLDNQKLKQKEKLTTSKVTEFKEIYSDTDYLIMVRFLYDENEYLREFSFKTKKYALPTVKFAMTEAKYQTINYEVVIDDPNNFVTFESVSLHFLNTFVGNNPNLKGSFKNLRNNMDYQLKINYTYDLHDGTIYLGKDNKAEVKTQKIDLSFINFELSTEKATISYDFSTGEKTNVTLDKVELSLEKELVKTNEGPSFTGSFTDLYNDNTYQLKAYYQINLVDEEAYKGTIIKKITTVKLEAPTLNFETEVGLDNIAYHVKFDDVDKIAILYEVKIYYIDKFVDMSIKLKDSFTGLTSGTNYKIEVSYFYNLNDHRTYNNKITKVFNFTTGVYTKPTFDFDNVQITAESFSAVVTMNDETKSVVPGTLKVRIVDKVHHQTYYPNDTRLVSAGQLLQGTDHLVIFTYEYNLNDGNGIQDGYYEYAFHTLDQMVITEFTIKKVNTDPNNEEFEIYINFKNPNYECINGFIINGVTIEYDKEYRPEFIRCVVKNIFNYSNYQNQNILSGLINRDGETLDVTGKTKY